MLATFALISYIQVISNWCAKYPEIYECITIEEKNPTWEQ
jgi:hypothetical protein